jgi:transposase InsO family protein
VEIDAGSDLPAAADDAQEPAKDFASWCGGYAKSELRSLQEKDPDVSFLIDLWSSCQARPPFNEVARQSPEVKALWTEWSKLSVIEGMLFRTVSNKHHFRPIRQYIVPMELRQQIFNALHTPPIAGHQGSSRTLEALKLRFYWPLMARDINRWIAECPDCSRTKPFNIGKGKAPMRTRPMGAPNERVGVDIMGPFRRSDKGNEYIVVFEDYFTKFVIAVPLPETCAQTIADVFIDRWVTYFTVPRQLHSDNGPQFRSDLIAELCEILRCEKSRSVPYRAQSNGLVERTNRTLQQMLVPYVNKDQNDWDDYLSQVVIAYNSRPHKSTGMSPYLLTLAHESNLPIDLQMDTGAREKVPDCKTCYCEWLKRSFYEAHAIARVDNEAASNRHKRRYDNRIRSLQFKRGTG